MCELPNFPKNLRQLHFSPSKGQAAKLDAAFRKNAEVTIEIPPSQLTQSGGYFVSVPPTTYNRVVKNSTGGKGTIVTISQTNVRKAIPQGQAGGSISSALSGIAAPLLGSVVRAAPTLAKGLLTNLASGAVSALGSLGLNKLFGRRGLPNVSAISPLLKHLISYKTARDQGIKMLFGGVEPVQVKGQLLKALAGFPPNVRSALLKSLGVKSGRGQIGGFLGTLAAIGIPLVMQALEGLFGKGVGGRVVIPPTSPPFYGSWDDYGMTPFGRGRGKKR